MAPSEQESHPAAQPAASPANSADSPASSADSPAPPPPTLSPLQKLSSRVSQLSRGRSHRPRRDSSSTDDSNPLEPLELAMTASVVSSLVADGYGGRGALGGGPMTQPMTHATTATSLGSMASRLPDFEVTFADDDPDNPRNWPLWYRLWTIGAISFATWTVVLYSTSYTAAIPGVMEAFGITSHAVATLGVTTYLLGLAVGAMVLAPLSELYGRRVVYLVCIVCFTFLVLPSARATSLAEILVVRFIGAFFGSALVTNGPASVVDISSEDNRALYMSIMAIAPMNAPVTGPLIGGFVFEYLGWRWDNWLVLILAGASVVVLATVRETYAPAILKARAARRRRDEGDDRYWCRYDERVAVAALLRANLARPFVLAATEPILWFFNLWISVVYGILYLCFVAYPLVFREIRGWSDGMSGLAFLGIGIGVLCAIVSEPLCRRLINNHPKDPETGRAPPEASARVLIIGAVLAPLGQLVFSWTGPAVDTVHWAVPIVFGIPFGAGNSLIFIYGSNYTAGAYGLYSASALCGNMVIRSVFGGTMPLAGTAMYKAMTIQWAGTFLGLLEVVMIPIPVVFLFYGARIRARSRVIRQMRADMERNEARRAKLDRFLARQEAKRQREAAAAAAAAAAADDDEDEAPASVDIERDASDASEKEPTTAAVDHAANHAKEQ